MDTDRPAPLGAAALGETDVVAVAVRQNYRSDVLEAAPHRGELSREVVPQAREPGIDDGDLAAVLDQVGVDDAVTADAANSGCDLHGFLVQSAIGPGFRAGIGATYE